MHLTSPSVKQRLHTRWPTWCCESFLQVVSFRWQLFQCTTDIQLDPYCSSSNNIFVLQILDSLELTFFPSSASRTKYKPESIHPTSSMVTCDKLHVTHSSKSETFYPGSRSSTNFIQLFETVLFLHEEDLCFLGPSYVLIASVRESEDIVESDERCDVSSFWSTCHCMFTHCDPRNVPFLDRFQNLEIFVSSPSCAPTRTFTLPDERIWRKLSVPLRWTYDTKTFFILH